MENQIVTTNGNFAPMNAKELQNQVNAIQEAMRQVMKEDTHYGLIPGCGNKPSLFKPGAEKICLMFRLIPSFEVRRSDLEGGHREYEILCTLKNPAGLILGSGVGICSTMEGKYRYRNAAKKCPHCASETIIKGKKEYGGGWICFAKKGGCGAKFSDGDEQITDQPVGKVENPDIADTYNTVLKMAKKRAHVDATITATAAGDIFTQDIEDMNFEPITPPSEPPKAEPEITLYKYDFEVLADDEKKYEKAKQYAVENGGEWDSDLGCWVAPCELPKLRNYKLD